MKIISVPVQPNKPTKLKLPKEGEKLVFLQIVDGHAYFLVEEIDGHSFVSVGQNHMHERDA